LQKGVDLVEYGALVPLVVIRALDFGEPVYQSAPKKSLNFSPEHPIGA
jgi:hypothetical protein